MNLVRDLGIAFRPPDEIRARQLELLRAHARVCRNRSPYYRERMGRLRIPHGIPLDDLLASLPLTEKADLESRNEAFLAVPEADVVDIVTSSGTTGKPTRLQYTEHDLRRLAYNEEKAFLGCGLCREDKALLTCTLDRCCSAGLAYFLGIRSLGAAAVRNGHDTLEGHRQTIHRIEPTALVGAPSFIRELGEYLQRCGEDPAALKVRCVVGIGEPVRGADMKLLRAGAKIESLWGARVYSTYAGSEIVTTFCECTAQRGGHLHPDLAIVEILDDQGRPVPAGKTGEVVVTPLGVEGMPLLRFRTGDISFLMDEPCACGRNSVRLGPILGRRAQMLKVQGATLYPAAVFAALSDMDEVIDAYLVAESAAEGSDRVTAHVSLVPSAQIGTEVLVERLQARLRVKPGVVIEPESELRAKIYRPESRKPVRFLDQRGRLAGEPSVGG